MFIFFRFIFLLPALWKSGVFIEKNSDMIKLGNFIFFQELKKFVKFTLEMHIVPPQNPKFSYKKWEIFVPKNTN